MKSYRELAQSVIYQIKESKVVLVEKAEELELIGEGRSAFAFKILSTNKVLKVYFPTHLTIVAEEAEVYKILSGNPFFSTLYDSGPNYIVIDYIEGNTLFDCLEKGIPIMSEHILAIDQALNLAKEQGLNPADIHLRNIILASNGTIKLIDVARFRQKEPCCQWSDLKKVYSLYKYEGFPKQFPAFLLNIVAFIYKKRYLKPFLQRL